jgi:ABC-type antimicrobial peptide transport system permease subunit
MSVTERFREIGTFKCLGALNTFVVRIFVLEAIYQGFLGGFAGSLAGALVISVSLLFKFGWDVLFAYPLFQVVVTCAETTILAVILSLLGVIYPALVAARMQPAVALRSEA